MSRMHTSIGDGTMARVYSLVKNNGGRRQKGGGRIPLILEFGDGYFCPFLSFLEISRTKAKGIIDNSICSIYMTFLWVPYFHVLIIN